MGSITKELQIQQRNLVIECDKYYDRVQWEHTQEHLLRLGGATCMR